MDAKHQSMLEEAQRNYRIIQEQQERYSTTLQSEIESQTKQLRDSKLAAEELTEAIVLTPPESLKVQALSIDSGKIVVLT